MMTPELIIEKLRSLTPEDLRTPEEAELVARIKMDALIHDRFFREFSRDWPRLHYSRDIACAWYVVEELRRRGYLVIIQERPDLDRFGPLPSDYVYPGNVAEYVNCQLLYAKGTFGKTLARKFHTRIKRSAETAAIAICLAALATLTDNIESKAPHAEEN